MYKKAIVLEIKAAYAIAMEEGGSIIRIKKKDGLSVGASIYVLPEDLYQEQEACAGSSLHQSQKNLIPFPGIKKRSLIKIASIAAMLILCVTLVIPQLTVTTYAQASFDGKGSIQLSLDRNLQIIKAVSPDQSVPDSVLKTLQGKHINEAGETLRLACGLDDVLVGYALTGKKEASSSLDRELRALFPPRSVTVINGTSQDIENAEKESLSLGKYLTSQQDKNSSDKPEDSDLDTQKQDEDEMEQETDTQKQDETEPDSDTQEQDETERDETERKDDISERDETEQEENIPERDETEGETKAPEQDEAEREAEASEQNEAEPDSDTQEQNEPESDPDSFDNPDRPVSAEQAENSPEESDSDPEQPGSSEQEEHSSSRDEDSDSGEDSDSEENSDSEEEEE